MAATKEAIAMVLDMGPGMNQAPPGVATPLETAIEGINMILQRKMFSESKDEVALILFGTEETENNLDDGENYQNITVKRPLGIADFDLLQSIQTDLEPGDCDGDFLDAIVVAMDHLENSLQGKKGFGSRRIILFSNLASPFGDQELDTIVSAISNTKTDLTVIGPNIDDDDDDDDDEEQKPSTSNGAGDSGEKEKTPQQRAGEGLMKHVLDQVQGGCYSFNEALPALSYFQSRQIKPIAWKIKLEIGEMEIPVNGYSKVKEFKLKQSWKKVYAQDTSVAPQNLRTYHMNNEEETEVERDEMVEGYRYGNTLVPMSEDDKDNMKLQSEKCLRILGFSRADSLKRQNILGDGVMSFTAEKGDEAAAVALSALINALYETNSIAIARRVYAKNSAPRLGCLFPHIKAKYECLFWVELPFAEDIRYFTFGSLPLTDDSPANKKLKPTDEQLQCMDNLITNMDLSQALEDDEEKVEALKPKLTFNPYFQRVYQCLQHRVLHPDDPLPELSPIIANYLKPPQSITESRDECLEQIKKLFKTEDLEKKKEQQTGENMFKNDDTDASPDKRPKVDDNLEGGIQNLTKAKVTEIGTVTPVEDFQALISRKDQDLFDEACQQMQKQIKKIVKDSFGQQFYGKAMDCVKTLRQECIKKSEPTSYNSFLQAFRDWLIDEGRRDFWDQIALENQSLISKVECEESGVTKEEAETFTAGEVKAEAESKSQDEETTDDLLMDL